MGYRLEISEFKDLNVGTKLFGYVDDETKLKSYQWLLEHRKIVGEECWTYGYNPKIILNSEEFKEFIVLYIEDKKEYYSYPNFEEFANSLLKISETEDCKLLEWY